MSDAEQRFGSQFDETRFFSGQDGQNLIIKILKTAFDARNVNSVEGKTPYDNYAESKDLNQIIDYTGIDFVVDPFDQPAFGVNHRVNQRSYHRLFDIRSDTGTEAPSEFEKIIKADRWDIVPKYATRLKLVDGTLYWLRVVRLAPFADAVTSGMQRVKTHHCDDGEVVYLYDYDDLRDVGCVVDEIMFGGGD